MTPGSQTTSLNAGRRVRELSELAGGTVVDVLVVGGGVTGTGVALDAASRGLSVALVERRDLAYGTSRWSSKLVHGGLRYLAHGDVRIAYESARERGILMDRTAPHLTRAAPFVLPLNDDLGALAGAVVDLGGRAGNVLRRTAGTSRRTLPRPRRITAAEAALLCPAVRREDLRGALLWWDGQLTDDARLVVALARTAAGFGARILTYCAVEELGAEGGLVVDERTGTRFFLRAHHVVNATGVWADRLAPQVELQPSKGAHLVVRAERLGHPTAATMVPVPGERGRWVFALPQDDGRVLIGLTDAPLVGPVPDVPSPDEDDTEALLGTINRVLADPLTAEDVVGSFAGLRPLLAGEEGATADLSRRHRLLEHDGVLTLVGGKLTTYRKMAQDAVDRIAQRQGVRADRCRTLRLPLVGAAPRHRLERSAAPKRLIRRYGTEATAVLALGAMDPSLAEAIAPGLQVTGAELAFAVAHEGALTVEDLLERRTRVGLVPADLVAARPAAERALATQRASA